VSATSRFDTHIALIPMWPIEIEARHSIEYRIEVDGEKRPLREEEAQFVAAMLRHIAQLVLEKREQRWADREPEVVRAKVALLGVKLAKGALQAELQKIVDAHGRQLAASKLRLHPNQLPHPSPVRSEGQRVLRSSGPRSRFESYGRYDDEGRLG
jgi:hypothetical protein